jgi:hypothetical protein
MSNQSPEPAAVPQTRGLAVPWPIPYSPKTAAEVGAYHRDAVEWEERESDLKERHKAFAKDWLHLLGGDCVAAGRELDRLRHQLHKASKDLHWRRFHLLRRLRPDAEMARANAAAEFESVVAGKMQDAIARGALHGLPGGDTDKGRHQLRHKLLANDLDVIAAKGRLNAAEEMLRAVEHTAMVPPSAKACKVDWERTGNPVVDAILSQTETPTDEPTVSFEAAPIRELAGLQAAAILDEHAQVLEQIKECLGVPRGGLGRIIKMRGLGRDVAERVIPLLARLPETHARNKALSEAREWVKHGHRMDPATTHYIDEQKSGFRQAADAVGSA